MHAHKEFFITDIAWQEVSMIFFTLMLRNINIVRIFHFIGVINTGMDSLLASIFKPSVVSIFRGIVLIKMKKNWGIFNDFSVNMRWEPPLLHKTLYHWYTTNAIIVSLFSSLVSPSCSQWHFHPWQLYLDKSCPCCNPSGIVSPSTFVFFLDPIRLDPAWSE